MCLPYIDVLFGIEPYHLWKDEQDHQTGDVKDGVPFQPDFKQQDEVFHGFVKRYPNIKCIARHVRYAHSCSENSLMAYLWYDGKTYESQKLRFHILDRVGGGDAFVSKCGKTYHSWRWKYHRRCFSDRTYYANEF